MTAELREADAKLLRRMRGRQDAKNAERLAADQWVGREAPILFGAATAAQLTFNYPTPGRALAALKRLTEAGYLQRIETRGCIVTWRLTHEGRRFEGIE